MSKKALIIGAGLGGLSTALRLTTQGYEVTILEKFHQAGGRLNQVKKDGFTFDVGPSFFSMSYEFEELFRSCGMENPLRFRKLSPLYAVHFAGREKPYLIYQEMEKLITEFKDVEPDFEIKLYRYLKEAKKLYQESEHKVVKKNFSSLLHYCYTLTTIPLRHGPKLFRSLWEELDRNFSSEEIKIIFSLVAFFLGATPFRTPAIYTLLNYTELEHDGYWNVEGGMYEIADGITNELLKRKVKFEFNTEVIGFEKGDDGLSCFIDQRKRRWCADVYVVNSDAAAFRGQVLGREKYCEEKLDKMQWTLAPYTVYLGIKGKLDKLYQHNYFLGNNFREYSETIFTSLAALHRPYYYVNVSSRSNPDCAPPGCENVFILCPVPDLRYKSEWRNKEHLADNIIEDLSSRINYDIRKNIITRTIFTPLDWQDKFNLYKGSGLGLGHGLGQIGAFRPKNKDEHFKNLYYVGASTTPGTGLPMVVISSRLATERIMQDQGVDRG